MFRLVLIQLDRQCTQLLNCVNEKLTMLFSVRDLYM